MQTENPKSVFQQLVADLAPRYGWGEARSIGRIVFEDGFGSRQPEGFVFSEIEEARFLEIRRRLLAGEPVQYVLGSARFDDFDLRVSPAVLIPRQETEELAHRIFETLAVVPRNSDIAQKPASEEQSSEPSVHRLLDIGTGSGCLPIFFKKKLPEWEVWACDVCSAALDLALENALMHETEIEFRLTDILNERQWADFPDASFEIVVSNPPYIPRGEAHLMPDWVKNFEPSLALFVDDPDTLIFYWTIANFCLKKMCSGGWLWFECNEFNAVEVRDLLSEKGFSDVFLEKDLAGAPRFVRGSLKKQEV